MNWQLYKLSANTIQLPYKKRRCRFTSAEGYFYSNIMKSSADIVLNIDEDAFITDNRILKNLLEYCLDNEYVNCGVPDGGVMKTRIHNPLVTNPFFNILNVKKIKEQFDISNIKAKYSVHEKEFEKFTPYHLLRSNFQYDFYEPYVPFFIWLTTNFKTLFLNAEEHADGISTKVLDHEGNPFLLHSWYSRFYLKDKYHTERIENLYRESTELEIDKKVKALDRIIEKTDQIGNEFYFPLKYRFERKFGY